MRKKPSRLPPPGGTSLIPLPPCQLQRVQQQGRRNTLLSTRPFPWQPCAQTLAPSSLLIHRIPACGSALGSHPQLQPPRATPSPSPAHPCAPPRPRPPRPIGRGAVVAAALTDARLQRLGLHIDGPRLLTGAAPLRHHRPPAGPGAAAP